MKFVHLADLHIGKRLRGTSLIEDQAYALDDILARVEAIRPDVALIAGDVYDKPVPSAEAVTLLGDFLTRLVGLKCQVCMIGGNHDSQERLSFLGPLLAGQGVFVAGPYEGRMPRLTLRDAHGELTIWLLPHILPREAARFFEGQDIVSVDDAVRAAIARESIGPVRRNVLVAHQFVVAGGMPPQLCDSEIHPVGGLDAVDSRAFDAFCYVALGHLHGAQRMGRETVRYAGSPVRYSFSEARHDKRFVSGEIGADGGVTLELIPIAQLHGMRELKGEIEQLLAFEHRAQGDADDYLRVTLTDRTPPMAAMERLSAVYRNVLALEFEPASDANDDDVLQDAGELDRLKLFTDFYRDVTGRALTDDERDYIAEVMDDAWKGSVCS